MTSLVIGKLLSVSGVTLGVWIYTFPLQSLWNVDTNQISDENLAYE